MTNFNYYNDDVVLVQSKLLDIFKELLTRSSKELESSNKCISICNNQFGFKSFGVK